MKQYLLPENGTFYKTNLHCHSTLSDGRFTREEIKEAYKANGYSAVAFTEHEGLFDSSHLTDEDFVAITSYEYSITSKENVFSEYIDEEEYLKNFKYRECIHLNFYAKDPHNNKMVCHDPKYIWGETRKYLDQLEYVGTPDYRRIYSVEKINEVIKAANDNGFLVVYNHPHWSINNASNIYKHLRGLHGIEIHNGASHRATNLDYVPWVYDEMARTGQRLICTAADDNHSTWDRFLAWTMIKADKLDYTSIMTAFEKGDCYCSSGPEIYNLFVEDKEWVTVRCSPVEAAYLTPAHRDCQVKFKETEDGLTEARFKIREADLYFRITLRDAKGNHANTRIYYFDELK